MQITLAKYRRECVMEKIGLLKQLLHGRKRKRMRLAMSDRVRDMESLLGQKTWQAHPEAPSRLYGPY